MAYASSNHPLVTIGIPVRNGEKYIREALDSAISQSYENIEILISDNASTDATNEICDIYASKDKRIRYVRQTTNIGSLANFNFVVEHASGAYFTWLAHDDVLHTNYVEQLGKFLYEHQNVALVASDFSIIDFNGDIIKQEQLNSLRPDLKWSTRRSQFFHFPSKNTYFCIYGLMRTQACKAVIKSIPETRLLTATEFPYLSRIATLGEIIGLPIEIRKYRNHATSSYYSEVAQQSRLSRLHKFRNYNIHINMLRIDQLRALTESNLSAHVKIAISMRIVIFYIGLFAKRILRIPFVVAKQFKR